MAVKECKCSHKVSHYEKNCKGYWCDGSRCIPTKLKLGKFKKGEARR